uniref:RING-type domain-containing protein n=1 Tax=viral metagenome TaxID=1070528 RepID=A0A6C0LZF3_9ZZZZ
MEQCGVCGIDLPSDANRAITACKHAFCISCLLKWYRVNPTCPLCRRLLHEEDNDDNEIQAQTRAEEEHIRQLMMQTDRIFEGLEFNMEEEITHDHMMEVIDINTQNHCRNNPDQTYSGAIHLRIVPKEDYDRIEVGTAASYILELNDTARAFRYRFGRIETVFNDERFPNLKWYAFRERIQHVDEDRAQIVTEWSTELQHIRNDNVRMIVRYQPDIWLNI